MKKILSTATLAIALMAAPALSVAQTVDSSDILNKIDALQTQINELKSQIKTANDAVEAVAENAEQGTSSNTVLEGISIGGYGELHYNNLDSGSKIDFHRFVLFFGKEFSDKLRFFSEVELEHAFSGEGKPGEVELEQAYIQYDFNENSSATAGVFLLPIGITNETHEPPTFFGVERNAVEKNIIPSTWWEAGLMFSSHTDSGFSYDIALHSGLNVPIEDKKAYSIRSGRQKVAKASAEDLAVTGRVRYTGVAGLELALSAQHQADITQGAEGASATLIEAHAIYNNGPFGLRALYAAWGIDSETAKALGKDSQDGFYIEPSYAVNDTWSFFARYSEYNTKAGLSDSKSIEQLDFGVNWNLHENVVIKADIQNQSGSKDNDGVNIGLGYQF